MPKALRTRGVKIATSLGLSATLLLGLTGTALADSSIGTNISTSAGGTITSAGLLTASTGLTVTAGGATVTAGGLTVTAGGAAVTGASTVTGALTQNTAVATEDQLSLAVAAGGAARFTGTVTNADLTAARTYTLPNLTGTFALSTNDLSVFAATTSAQLAGVLSNETGSGVAVFGTAPTIGGAADLSGAELVGASPLVLEGATADGFETTLALVDPTADRTITLPNATGTVLLSTDTLAAHAATTSAQLLGVLSDETGTGAAVFATSPTLVTPALGTPASGVLTNATGLPISTGVSGLAAGVATALATPSSANLIAAVTDETGTGALVFATSPTLVTPALGTPASGVLTNATGLPISTGVSGLAAGVATALATPSSANLITAVTDETGTGALVFATSPTLVTPALGTPASGVLTNATGLPISTGVSGLAAGVADFLGTSTSANLATAVTNETGSGALVFATSPTLVTPALGTPASGVLTNATGLPISTGVDGLAAGVATALATPSSANLITAVTDETGTGALVFATSPTLVTPALGVPASGTLTNATGLPISTGVSGLAAGVADFLGTSTSANLATAVTNETGSGALVFATSPTLVTPVLGVAAATSIAIASGTAIAGHTSELVSVDFAAITAPECDTKTVAVAGAATGDTVALGPPSTVAAAVDSWSAFVPSAGNVTVRICAIAGDLADPAAANWRFDIWKH